MTNVVIQLPTICHKPQRYCSIEALIPISQPKIFDSMECIFNECLMTYSLSVKLNYLKSRKLKSRIQIFQSSLQGLQLHYCH